MLITKFNKMIRNKIIWAFIAIVTSVFFVLSASSFSGSCSADAETAEGRLYGEDVSPGDFRNAMFFELGMRRSDGFGSDPDTVRTRTWRRLAVLSQAEKFGLLTDDDEVRSTLGSIPEFSPDRQFEQSRYFAFIQSQNLHPSTFEEYLRQDLTIKKMRGTADAFTWVAPTELSRRFSNLTDIRTLEIGRLDRQNLTPEVSVADDDIRDFYTENTNLFTAASKMQVRYVEFPFSNYVPESNDAARVEAYYNANLEAYTPEPTNDFFLPEALPLDQVRAEIEATLKEKQSTEDAMYAATDFVDALSPIDVKSALSFEATAATNNLEVMLTGLFAIDEPVEGLDVDYRFRRAAFDLVPNDPQFYYSEVIEGSNAAYVIAYETNTPSRVMALDEVLEDASEYALSNAAHIAFMGNVSAIHSEISESLSTNRTFTDLLSVREIVVTSVVFSVFETISTNVFEDDFLLVPKIIDLRAGDLSEPVETPDGAIIAYAVDRAPTSPENNLALRQQLLLTLHQYRSQLVFEDYSDYLLEVAEFEDIRASAKDDEEGDESRSDSSSSAGSGSK
jgi:hypothetical protein